MARWWSRRKNTGLNGVRGLLITDENGVPMQTDFSARTTEIVAGQVALLVECVKTLVDGLDEGDLHLLKLETTNGAVLIELKDA
nr:roadblock/LC7 domain-containing protein [Candidatus Sigynarchaeota archaeon]